MKKFIFAAVCVLSMGTALAQDFVKGGNYVTVGYGIDPWGYPGVGLTTSRTVVGPIMATYEHGVTDVLGIGRIGAGGGIAQSFYTQKYVVSNVFGTYENVYRRSRFSVIVRATYHFEFDIPKMDVYAGVGGAIHVNTDKDREYVINNGTIVNGYVTQKSTSIGGGHYVFAGIRYYFTDFFGVYAEAGHGINALNGGVVLSF